MGNYQCHEGRIFQLLPHTHCGPTIRRFKITNDDDMIILGSKQLWDFISYESAVDIIRKDKNDPMVAAKVARFCYMLWCNR